ncbi:4'-phosphopantetheinyl transferase superfamily protein [Deinococcus sp. QL22]|uniref:4'-phosphopantetheinyl transferase family protein n=1 Tax=Deinococcus sp. QL22 TaxID=2939437 RepID=UPI0020171B43|nr:4'-phosphopantetheinyl transferase superfamily protein [Deinococcus sp. QL22]UQN09204.1 4'-phosphopantetheinyl transferase superfamily protein [Deinococcus sp. QL22]
MHLLAAETGAWQLAACLSGEELARAEAYAGAPARGFYVASVVFRRTVLGAVLHIPPAEVRFERLPGRTKPQLAASQNPENWRFSLSHSGELALLALGCGREVGVDLERMRAGVNWRGVAQTAFSPYERAALLAVGPPHRLDMFYRLWTAKEAYLKACGLGLSVPLEAVSVILAGAEIDVLQAVHGDLRQWRGQCVPLPPALIPAYRAAVVVQAAPRERLSLSVQHWNPLPSADI